MLRPAIAAHFRPRTACLLAVLSLAACKQDTPTQAEASMAAPHTPPTAGSSPGSSSAARATGRAGAGAMSATTATSATAGKAASGPTSAAAGAMSASAGTSAVAAGAGGLGAAGAAAATPGAAGSAGAPTTTTANGGPGSMQDAQHIVAALRIGWNLGNSMDAVGGETSWGNPMVTPALIQAVAAAGFGAVRIPVTWVKHFGPGPMFTIDPAWMKRVEDPISAIAKPK